jgi:CHAT domain-containing protein
MLYNYEISLLKVASPMIVLSSCNSGTGKLYHSEGLMSLARSFFLSGASSVIMTSWEINDEVSAGIMSRFYFYLSKGKRKDDALHLAKIDFLNNNLPSLMNPYYWAAYKELGNNSPVTFNSNIVLFSASVLLVIIACTMIYYFRRRRICPADSL